MPKFEDIRRISRAHWMVHVGWTYLKSWLKDIRRAVVVDMDPPYQRGYVWTLEQKVSYLEYVLKDGTSAKDIYWNCPGWQSLNIPGPLELVDGKQRISSVLDFLDGKIKVFGHYFNEYEDKLDFLVARFNFHVHDLEDKKDIVQWYLDMNTGGSVHTEKDLEPACKLLYELEREEI